MLLRVVEVGLTGGIFCHGHNDVPVDLPVVEHPLERHLGGGEHGIVVHHDDNVVLLEELLGKDDFGPVGGAVGILWRPDELVRVAVNLGVEIVAEEACRRTAQLVPGWNAFAVENASLARQVARIHVEDADPLPHGLRVNELILGRQQLFGSVEGHESWRRDGQNERLPERANDVREAVEVRGSMVRLAVGMEWAMAVVKHHLGPAIVAPVMVSKMPGVVTGVSVWVVDSLHARLGQRPSVQARREDEGDDENGDQKDEATPCLGHILEGGHGRAAKERQQSRRHGRIGELAGCAALRAWRPVRFGAGLLGVWT